MGYRTNENMYVKTCDYCTKRITKEDIPYEVDGGYVAGYKVTYDLCLPCRTVVAGFKKSTVSDYIASRHQDCCTAMDDECKCCDNEHECLEDIPQMVLE